MSKTKKCAHCDNQIAVDAKTCPKCGGKNVKPIYKRTWFIIVVTIFILGSIGNSVKEKPQNNSQTKQSSNKTDKTAQANIKTNEIQETKKPETHETKSKPDIKETQETKANDLTIGQKNALKAAKNYISFTPLSHSGLIKQLEFEKYTSEDAKYAADNCGANWNEQAAKAAKNYLNLTSFSRASLITQLEFEGYTSEQAAYGADANGY